MNEIAKIRNPRLAITLITDRSVNTPKPDRSFNNTVSLVKYRYGLSNRQKTVCSRVVHSTRTCAEPSKALNA